MASYNEDEGGEGPHPDWLDDEMLAGMDSEMAQEDEYDRVSSGEDDGELPEDEKDPYWSGILGNELNGR